MQSNNSSRMSKTNRSGSAILLILVVVAIGVILYFIDLSAIFSTLPTSENPASSHEVLPWEHKEKLLMPGQEPDIGLSQDQPSIDNGIDIVATVEQSNTARDFIVNIAPDGTVQGGWYADYNKGKKPRMNYVMSAGFKGNIDPTVIFFDENGEDPTKLFLVAKGEISILASNLDGGAVHNSIQDIWVSGWVDKEQEAKGEMLLITGKKTYQTFNWKSSYRSKKQKGLF